MESKPFEVRTAAEHLRNCAALCLRPGDLEKMAMLATGDPKAQATIIRERIWELDRKNQEQRTLIEAQNELLATYRLANEAALDEMKHSIRGALIVAVVFALAVILATTWSIRSEESGRQSTERPADGAQAGKQQAQGELRGPAVDSDRAKDQPAADSEQER